MTPNEIISACSGTIIVPPQSDAQITSGYTSDMLSDVIANAEDDSVLITIQNHLNTIAVCTLAGIKLIVVCHNRPIPDDMKSVAEKEHIGIVSSPLSQFEASHAIGKLIRNS